MSEYLVNTLICIIGKSGSGKSTIAQELKNILGLKILKSYTTRPKRNDDEADHIFISENSFNVIKYKLCAYTVYNGEQYGALPSQVEASDLYIIDVDGLKYLKEHYDGKKDIVPIYISVPRAKRMQNMEERGDTDKQIKSKLKFDDTAFKNVKDYCDYTIRNDYLTQTILQIANIILHINKEKTTIKTGD